ncbi:uncharacterized protein LOC128175210 [Crassostrea angulata]|uniref:uncharacterized protein LOC128175210 n=1 Tax=Magallana angulata TaxID=2784310 RepID=UPI0022B0F30C|nr:uncharacterized protein LOC128175210 [Crassostrea angulata]
MKNVPCLSRSVYEGLCEKVGNSTKVNFRREVIDITEDLLSTSNVCFENRCYKFKLSGSFREGFRLKTSDIDMLGWCLSDKVVSNPSQICLYHNPHHTVILMECDDLPPGFTRLKLIVPGHVFHEISCVEINDELYVPNYSFTKNMVKTLESTDFNRTFYHGPAISMVSALLETDIVICLKSDHWPDTAKPWIQRCQQSGWPVETVVSQIVNSGCHVVPIGSTSDENLEWRISFSNAEQMIVYSLNHCQFICYGLLKIFLKEVINEQSKSPILCSYFIKTVLFWVIQNDRTLKWTPENLLCCFWNCFKLLIHWVNTGCCPNFFIPQNNMFKVKVTGHAQAALFDQLYDFYANGIECLCLSPTIKLYFNDAIINKNLPFMQETSRYLNDVHVLEELQTIGKIVTPLTVKNLEEVVVFMNRIEKFLKGNITKYQAAIVQYMTALIIRYAGMILQRMLQKKMCRKHTYLTKKWACSMFKFSSAIGSVPEHLYLAMYYYGDGQYEQSLRCTQRARPCSVEVKSFNAMMRKCMIYFINIGNADTFFGELVIEQNANEEISGKSGELIIPFNVMLHMMLILNYHKLGARVLAQQSLQDLRTLLHNGKRSHVPTIFREIYPYVYARLRIYGDPYYDVPYADISWQILGICQHICGDYLGALNSYQRSLAVKSFHRIHKATYLRMLISLFALIQSRSKYWDG